MSGCALKYDWGDQLGKVCTVWCDKPQVPGPGDRVVVQQMKGFKQFCAEARWFRLRRCQIAPGRCASGREGRRWGSADTDESMHHLACYSYFRMSILLSGGSWVFDESCCWQNLRMCSHPLSRHHSVAMGYSDEGGMVQDDRASMNSLYFIEQSLNECQCCQVCV